MNQYSIVASRGFFDDLGALPENIYKRAIESIDQLLANPNSPGLSTEKIKNADKGVHSSRVDQAYRIIWKK